MLKNTSVGALAQKQRPFYWCWSVAVGNRVKTVTNSILFVLREETITQESITQSLTTIKYLLWPWMFYSGWIFILLRPEELSSSLLARRLSILKILGSNPGISGRKEEILGHVFTLKRAHRAETDFTNIEWFPHRLLTGATTQVWPKFQSGLNWVLAFWVCKVWNLAVTHYSQN